MKYIATVNGKVYEVEIERVTGAGRRPPYTSAAPVPTAAQEVSPPAAAPKPEAAPSASGTAVLSPMPGSVLDILPKVGDRVAAGQTVALLEAMKMEIEIKAESAGVVSSICVKKGDTVDSGAALLRL